MANYGTIGHLLSESYFGRVAELRAEGLELGEAARKARSEMIFAGRITEEDEMPRIEAEEAASVTEVTDAV